MVITSRQLDTMIRLAQGQPVPADLTGDLLARQFINHRHQVTGKGLCLLRLYGYREQLAPGVRGRPDRPTRALYDGNGVSKK